MAHDHSYLLVDGENIDATLGTSILGARPAPEQRPRWDRVREFTSKLWSKPCKGLFFLNASSGVLPASFIQALLALPTSPPRSRTQPEPAGSVGPSYCAAFSPWTFSRVPIAAVRAG